MKYKNEERLAAGNMTEREYVSDIAACVDLRIAVERLAYLERETRKTVYPSNAANRRTVMDFYRADDTLDLSRFGQNRDFRITITPSAGSNGITFARSFVLDGYAIPDHGLFKFSADKVLAGLDRTIADYVTCMQRAHDSRTRENRQNVRQV